VSKLHTSFPIKISVDIKGRGLIQKLQAQMHSNEPSRGAKIDKVLKNEDEAEIRQKDEAVAF
jgi:hypothetical protein